MGSLLLRPQQGNPQQALKYKGMFDSGCSRHMTGNKALLDDFKILIRFCWPMLEELTVGGKIIGIGKIRTNKIDFEDVFFVKELKFNLFSVSQMCDKKNSVLFTETECLVLSPDFKLIDESQARFDGKELRTGFLVDQTTKCSPQETNGNTATKSTDEQAKKDTIDDMFVKRLTKTQAKIQKLLPLAMPMMIMTWKLSILLMFDQSVGAEADFNNMEPSTVVSPIPITRVHSIHPKAQIIGDPKSAVEAMQEELLQFKIQKVWTLVDLPSGKKAIGTKLVAQGYKQEEGIDYDEVFAPVARVEAIRSIFANLQVYMDLRISISRKSTSEKALYGLHQAPRAWYETLSTYLMDNGFHRGQIDNTLFIKRLQCKKQTVMANLNTKAKYIAAAHCLVSVFDCKHCWVKLCTAGTNVSTAKAQLSTAVYICIGVADKSLRKDIAHIMDVFSVLVIHHTINGYQFTMSNRQERIGYSRANDNCFVQNATVDTIIMEINMLSITGEGPSSPGGTQHTSTLIETSPQLQNISNTYRKTRTRTRRMGIRIPQSDVPTSVADEAIIKEMHDGLARPERVSNLPNEPPLREGNTSRSGEGSMQLLELINLCTKLSDKVTLLEDELASTKAVYNKLITLTKRVKKLEK
ncbi:retrovirus-related pol polyprotein from transposon TNT 1-94 [Tanacetum coccineum]